MPDSRLFATLRIAVSRHNARFNTNYAFNVRNGAAVVTDPTYDGRKERSKLVGIERPSKLEFIEYIATMLAGSSFKMPAAYQDRFQELSEYVSEYMEATAGVEYDAVITDGELVITRS